MRVDIKGIGVSYGSFIALHGIDLTVERGSLVTLLGPSGCGKTTLLRSIAGIARPDKGDILFDGRRMNDVAVERRNIGMVFQTYALFPHMTIFRNLAFGLEMRSVPKPKIRERVMRALELVELQHLAERYPRQLSGGQQQRVALARAVVIEPDVLLFDEPLSNLDAKLRESLREDLKALQRKLGITSIYVTHDQSEAMALADHIVVMRGGRIVEQGAPQTLYRRPRERYVAEFLGHTNVVAAAPVSHGRVRLPWGAERPLDETLDRDSSSEVSVSLRPEDIRIVPADQAPGGEGTGTVRDVTFLGSHVQYRVSIADLVVRVQATGEGHAVLSPGAEVGLIAPEIVHALIDTKSDVAGPGGGHVA
jgi:putative spermidine/putrescine transport system ATP-binding protein